MLISFIISSQAKEAKIIKTINSLKRQTNADYELIIVNDDPGVSKETTDFFKAHFFDDPQTVVAFNHKPQGWATNWNLGLTLARGQYVTFLKEGDILEDGYVETLLRTIAIQKEPVDLFEIKQQLAELSTGVVHSQLEEEVLYHLGKQPDVYAYISPLLYGKVFRMEIIKAHDITFRDYIRFDALFLYKFLHFAKNYYQLNKVLLTHRTTVLKYSTFDLVHQWPHIFNYYRTTAEYKKLTDELEYAYFHFLAITFLHLVKEFDNKALYKKSQKYVEARLDRKTHRFMRENRVFLEHKDPEFEEAIKGIDKRNNALKLKWRK